MTGNSGRIRAHPIRILTVLVSLVLLAALTGPLSARADRNGSNKVTHVNGTVTVIDADTGTLRLEGGLRGTLYTTALTILLESPGMDVQQGTERIEGCLDRNRNGRCGPREPSGKLFTEYVYWATFDPATGRLLQGQCAHPIVRGTGDFAGTRGLIHMVDVQVGDEIRTTYEADLVLGAVKEPKAPAAGPADAQPVSGVALTGTGAGSTC